MGLGFRKGSSVRVSDDGQGDLAVSVIGRRGTIVGRARELDMCDGEKAYAVCVNGRKTPKVFWETELTKIHK